MWDADKPDGQPRRCLDTSRARDFGFEAATPFDEGLRRTMQWWREQNQLGFGEVKYTSCQPFESTNLKISFRRR